MEPVINVTKVYKLKFERRGRITKDWLAAEQCGDFMTKLSSEMVNNDILLESEAHSLTAEELGYDI